MRWPMQATRMPTHSQRASRAVAVLQSIATTFVMHAMVRRSPRQLKMPRQDAYAQPAWGSTQDATARRLPIIGVKPQPFKVPRLDAYEAVERIGLNS